MARLPDAILDPGCWILDPRRAGYLSSIENPESSIDYFQALPSASARRRNRSHRPAEPPLRRKGEGFDLAASSLQMAASPAMSQFGRLPQASGRLLRQRRRRAPAAAASGASGVTAAAINGPTASSARPSDCRKASYARFSSAAGGGLPGSACLTRFSSAADCCCNPWPPSCRQPLDGVDSPWPARRRRHPMRSGCRRRLGGIVWRN